MNLEGRDLTKIKQLEKGCFLERAYLKGAILSPNQIRQLFIHQPRTFNKYRADNPDAIIDLTGLDVKDATIHRQNLEGVDLRTVFNLERADVRLLKGAIITPEQEEALRSGMRSRGLEVIFDQLRFDVQPLLSLPEPTVNMISHQQPLLEGGRQR